MTILSTDYIGNVLEALCNYFCWMLAFNGAGRILWLGIIWFVLEFIIRIIALKNVSPRLKDQYAQSKDEGSWWVIAFSSILMTALILSVLHFRLEPDLPDIFIPIGMFLMGLGMIVRIWAVQTLGKFFTMEVMIFPNHHLVEAGPYRWLRHPSYLGVLLLAIGFGLASGYIMVLAIFTLILALTLSYRIHVEEKALADKFGQEWQAYSADRWMLLPWII